MDNRVRVCLTCSSLLLKEEVVCPECGSMETEVLEEDRPNNHDHVITQAEVHDIYDEFSDLSDTLPEQLPKRKCAYEDDDFDNFTVE